MDRSRIIQVDEKVPIGQWIPLSIQHTFAMFSASMDDDEPQYFDIHPVNFESKGEYREYLNAMRSRSLWKAPADVNEEDELIVLVTCSYNFINSRHLLYCRRLRADETPEQMQALYLNQAQP